MNSKRLTTMNVTALSLVLKGSETANQTNKIQVKSQDHCKMIPHSALNSLKQPNKMQSKAYFPSTPFAFYFKEISTCDVEIVLCHVKQWGM